MTLHLKIHASKILIFAHLYLFLFIFFSDNRNLISGQHNNNQQLKNTQCEKKIYIFIQWFYTQDEKINTCQVKALTCFQVTSQVQFYPLAQHFILQHLLIKSWTAFKSPVPTSYYLPITTSLIVCGTTFPLSIVSIQLFALLLQSSQLYYPLRRAVINFQNHKTRTNVYTFKGDSVNKKDHLRNARKNWLLQNSEQPVQIVEEQHHLFPRLGSEKKEKDY